MRVHFHHLITAGLAMTSEAIRIDGESKASSSAIEESMSQIAAGEGEFTAKGLQVLAELHSELES